jgi:hypothetical protein
MDKSDDELYKRCEKSLNDGEIIDGCQCYISSTKVSDAISEASRKAEDLRGQEKTEYDAAKGKYKTDMTKWTNARDSHMETYLKQTAWTNCITLNDSARDLCKAHDFDDIDKSNTRSSHVSKGANTILITDASGGPNPNYCWQAGADHYLCRRKASGSYYKAELEKYTREHSAPTEPDLLGDFKFTFPEFVNACCENIVKLTGVKEAKDISQSCRMENKRKVEENLPEGSGNDGRGHDGRGHDGSPKKRKSHVITYIIILLLISLICYVIYKLYKTLSSNKKE